MRLVIALSVIIFLSLHSFSQSVGIGTLTPDPSAQLDVYNTSKGFLPPRIMLLASNLADPILNPAIGLLVFNTATSGAAPYNVLPGYYYWDGLGWVKLNNDRSESLNGIVIKNFNEAVVQNTIRTLIVPTSKVWRVNYWDYSGGMKLGDVAVGTGGLIATKYNILLNEADSISFSNINLNPTPIPDKNFFVSISEYPKTSIILKNFNDSIAASGTKLYIVPSGKVWKLNFCVESLISIKIGNPSILISPLYSNINADTNIFLTPGTQVLLNNVSGSSTAKYFLSISEYNE